MEIVLAAGDTTAGEDAALVGDSCVEVGDGAADTVGDVAGAADDVDADEL